jgi:hypothetical protein
LWFEGLKIEFMKTKSGIGYKVVSIPLFLIGGIGVFAGIGNVGQAVAASGKLFDDDNNPNTPPRELRSEERLRIIMGQTILLGGCGLVLWGAIALWNKK